MTMDYTESLIPASKLNELWEAISSEDKIKYEKILELNKEIFIKSTLKKLLGFLSKTLFSERCGEASMIRCPTLLRKEYNALKQKYSHVFVTDAKSLRDTFGVHYGVPYKAEEIILAEYGLADFENNFNKYVIPEFISKGYIVEVKPLDSFGEHTDIIFIVW